MRMNEVYMRTPGVKPIHSNMHHMWGPHKGAKFICNKQIHPFTHPLTHRHWALYISTDNLDLIPSTFGQLKVVHLIVH